MPCALGIWPQRWERVRAIRMDFDAGRRASRSGSKQLMPSRTSHGGRASSPTANPRVSARCAFVTPTTYAWNRQRRSWSFAHGQTNAYRLRYPISSSTPLRSHPCHPRTRPRPIRLNIEFALAPRVRAMS